MTTNNVYNKAFYYEDDVVFDKIQTFFIFEDEDIKSTIETYLHHLSDLMNNHITYKQHKYRIVEKIGNVNKVQLDEENGDIIVNDN